jgi:hypothetical protein
MLKERKISQDVHELKNKDARPDAAMSEICPVIMLQSCCSERSQETLKLAANQVKVSTVMEAMPKRNLSVRRSLAVMAPLQVGHWKPVIGGYALAIDISW